MRITIKHMKDINNIIRLMKDRFNKIYSNKWFLFGISIILAIYAFFHKPQLGLPLYKNNFMWDNYNWQEKEIVAGAVILVILTTINLFRKDKK